MFDYLMDKSIDLELTIKEYIKKYPLQIISSVISSVIFIVLTLIVIIYYQDNETDLKLYFFYKYHELTRLVLMSVCLFFGGVCLISAYFTAKYFKPLPAEKYIVAWEKGELTSEQACQKFNENILKNVKTHSIRTTKRIKRRIQLLIKNIKNDQALRRRIMDAQRTVVVPGSTSSPDDEIMDLLVQLYIKPSRLNLFHKHQKKLLSGYTEVVEAVINLNVTLGRLQNVHLRISREKIEEEIRLIIAETEREKARQDKKNVDKREEIIDKEYEAKKTRHDVEIAENKKKLKELNESDEDRDKRELDEIERNLRKENAKKRVIRRVKNDGIAEKRRDESEAKKAERKVIIDEAEEEEKKDYDDVAQGREPWELSPEELYKIAKKKEKTKDRMYQKLDRLDD